MADIITNGTILDYVINVKNQLEDGTLPAIPDPTPDTTTGPLTDEEIADFRAWRNEIKNRFNTGGGAE